MDELRAAQNAHTTDITDIIDALEPFVADDLDDPENASSLDSDSINTQLGMYFIDYCSRFVPSQTEIIFPKPFLLFGNSLSR